MDPTSWTTLLQQTGPGRHITPSAYDTAWVARLVELGEPIGTEALEWLREHQLSDGSWGAGQFLYYHDRLVCTLAAMIALYRCGRGQDRRRLEWAELALERAIKGLGADPAGETVGFEMIVPGLLAEASLLGLVRPEVSHLMDGLIRFRAAKLAALPGKLINRYVTVAFSSEMVGADGLQLLDVERLRDSSGSVSYSPAATAFFALYIQPGDPAALQYLREFSVDGAVPYVVPIDIFERSWPLWNLNQAGILDDELLSLCQPHLDYLEHRWSSKTGIATVTGLGFPDGDATSMTYDVLTAHGRSVSLDGVLYYENEDHFRCYALEANPSVSTNIHVLGALRRTGLRRDHASVAKVLAFLRQTQSLRTFWFDKWHASPYYPTAHCVIACAGLDDDLVDDAVYWILATQNDDGSWGYYMPTAEETAYCLQALALWKQRGGEVPADVLKRGRTWLADHTQPPYPPLWIGKCLYCPVLVVRSAIMSALAVAGQQ